MNVPSCPRNSNVWGHTKLSTPRLLHCACIVLRTKMVWCGWDILAFRVGVITALDVLLRWIFHPVLSLFPRDWRSLRVNPAQPTM